MSVGRTVTVHTCDHGPVTTPEPAWCTGRHEDGLHLVDVSHDGPDIPMAVSTEDGPVELLHLLLSQYPYGGGTEGQHLHMAVLLGGGYHRFRDDTALYRLADELVEHAVQLRILARRLASLQSPEGAL